MFGGLRLALAATVVAFHAGVTPGGLWIGVSAVIVFYMISGYVMTALLTTRFTGPGSLGLFYAERCVRIAPQYYFWLAIAFLCALVLGWTPLRPDQPSGWTVFAYVTLIPLALQRYLADVNFAFIPQATSLAIEAVMYLLAPFVVRSRFWSAVVTLACLAVFAATAVGLLPANIYTYYCAPAPTIFFMLGSYVRHRDWTLLAAGALALLIFLLMGFPTKFSPEMALGVALGLPLIVLLEGRKGGVWDDRLGTASYGCFLGQVVVFDALLRVGAEKGSLFYIVSSVLLSCLAGYASFWLVERPTIAFRRRLRSRRDRSQTGAAPDSATALNVVEAR